MKQKMQQKTNQKKYKEKTFKEITEEWLEFRMPKIKESTLLNYKYIIETRLENKLGKLTLEEYNFNSYVKELMETLSNKTVRDTMTILKQILRYIEVRYNMNFRLSLISSPALSKTEIEIFRKYDRKKLEKFCLNSEDPKNLGFLISIYTGLRIGEVCALKWKDVDFETKSINVNHTLQRVYLKRSKSKVIITTPKTQTSIRKVPIAKKLYEKLKIMSKKYPKDAYVLTGEIDKYVEPLGYRYTYRMILSRLRIDYKKYHCLRHTFATRCVKVGMDIKSLSEILGHSNVNVTLDVYVHSSFETKKKYIDRL